MKVIAVMKDAGRGNIDGWRPGASSLFAERVLKSSMAEANRKRTWPGTCGRGGGGGWRGSTEMEEKAGKLFKLIFSINS